MLQRDFSLAWRKVVRRPGAAVLAVLSLALAIGFSTAAFSVVDAYYWRAMPLAEPERLAHAGVRNREGRYDEFSWPEFQAIQQQTGVLAGMVVQDRVGPTVKLPDRDDFPITAGVSDNFFDVLGVQAALGQVFHANRGADGEVVLSDRYWKSAFGGDPNICGRTISVGGAALRIMGIAPPGFQGTVRGVAGDLFVPHQTFFGGLHLGSAADTKGAYYEGIIRLKPGVSLDAARRQMDSALRQVEAAGMAPDKGRSATAESYTHPEGPQTATPGDIFPWIVALVLAIAAANFANLRLIENQMHRRETGIRLAIGAGRAALLRQHLSESLLLAGSATGIGLLLAAWLIELAPSLLYAGQRYREYFIRLDARVFAFSAGVMLLVAAVGTMVPLRDVWRVGVMPALHAAASRSASRWLTGLVMLQVAMITAVAYAAGLLWSSLQNVAAIRPAMDPDRKILLIQGGWYVEGPVAGRTERLAAELGSLPRVESVAWCRRVMLAGSGGGMRTAFERPGQPKLTFRYTQVSPNYFAVTGARVLRGRTFSQGDGPDSALVVMVSEAFVRSFLGTSFLGTQDALSAWVRIGGKDRQIVGIVEDGPSENLKEKIEPFVYFPFAQRPAGDMTFLLQTAGDPGRITAAARERIRKSDAAYSVFQFQTLAQYLRGQREDEELAADVSGGLALLCLVLAAAGLFGVTLYAVTRRMREFGVRVALGATPALLRRQVIREALAMALPGVGLGCGLALACDRFLESRLYGVMPGATWTLAAAGLLVTAVAVAASLAPARRAAHADPMEALRVE
jgi:predicted permease